MEHDKKYAIQLAMEYGFTGGFDAQGNLTFDSEFVEAVLEAVQREREACTKVCEDRVPTYLKDGERWLKGDNGKPDKRLKDIAPNLEAAWEAEQLLKNGSIVESITEANKCAIAIRARSETTLKGQQT